jgi:hypothetical protein
MKEAKSLLCRKEPSRAADLVEESVVLLISVQNRPFILSLFRITSSDFLRRSAFDADRSPTTRSSLEPVALRHRRRSDDLDVLYNGPPSRPAVKTPRAWRGAGSIFFREHDSHDAARLLGIGWIF